MYKYFFLVLISATMLSCDKNNDSNKTSGDLVATFNRGQANDLELILDQYPFWSCDTSNVICLSRGLQCELMQAKVFVTIYSNSNVVDTYYVAKNVPVTFAGLAAGNYELAAITYAPFAVYDSSTSLFNIGNFNCETQLESFQIIGGQTTTIVLDTIWND